MPRFRPPKKTRKNTPSPPRSNRTRRIRSPNFVTRIASTIFDPFLPNNYRFVRRSRSPTRKKKQRSNRETRKRIRRVKRVCGRLCRQRSLTPTPSPENSTTPQSPRGFKKKESRPYRKVNSSKQEWKRRNNNNNNYYNNNNNDDEDFMFDRDKSKMNKERKANNYSKRGDGTKYNPKPNSKENKKKPTFYSNKGDGEKFNPKPNRKKNKTPPPQKKKTPSPDKDCGPTANWRRKLQDDFFSLDTIKREWNKTKSGDDERANRLNKKYKNILNAIIKNLKKCWRKLDTGIRNDYQKQLNKYSKWFNANMSQEQKQGNNNQRYNNNNNNNNNNYPPYGNNNNNYNNPNEQNGLAMRIFDKIPTNNKGEKTLKKLLRFVKRQQTLDKDVVDFMRHMKWGKAIKLSDFTAGQKLGDKFAQRHTNAGIPNTNHFLDLRLWLCFFYGKTCKCYCAECMRPPHEDE